MEAQKSKNIQHILEKLEENLFNLEKIKILRKRHLRLYVGLPRWLSHKESAYQCGIHRSDPRVSKDLLKKEMETHSNILAWEILWTDEPGGLQSLESKNCQTQFSD